MNRYRFAWTLAVAVVLVAGARGAAAQDCSKADSLSNYGNPPADIYADVRPDLSNPGARALAMGGAFISTADDATSVIANPAGLGAVVRPEVQGEIRLLPVAQADRYPSSGLFAPGAYDYTSTTASSAPFFVSGLLPVGDRVVVGAFYQQVYRGGSVSRASSSKSGPCIATSSTSQMYMPAYSIDGNHSISRFGASVAWRVATSVSLGLTGYGLTENGSQTFSASDAIRSFPGKITVDSPGGVAYGYILGLQFTPSQSLKLGLTYASEPSSKEATYSGSIGLTPFRTKTFLPARLGAGLTYSPDTRLSLAADVVYVFSGKQKDALNFGSLAMFGPNTATDPGQWSASNHFELRLGGEYAAVQTRTNIFLVRLGMWAETASNLKYSGLAGAAFQAQNDVLSAIFPNTDDATAFHVTGGFGVLLQKTWQIDLGVDYETNLDKKFVASLLLGYTF